ncbi:MAG: amino acid ABC transporter permease [Burkholderiaceae bacterium]|nr:amino acid ABC transporter permease [Burkholderiaceae bacterium]
MTVLSKRDDASGFPWWMAALGFLFALMGYKIWSDDLYAQILSVVSEGVWITLYVTAIAFALATLTGLLVALAFKAPNNLVRQAARFYCEVIRGIPVLVLLFYMAFVAAPVMVSLANALLVLPREAGWIDQIEVRDFSLTWRAIIALTISYSAFLAEVFRAGLQAVDHGQIEAAKALGMSRTKVFRYITFPIAFRIILPPLGNDFIAMIKDSALVSVLGVADITQMAKMYAGGSFLFFETYSIVAMIYLALTIGLSLLLRGFERRLRVHEDR